MEHCLMLVSTIVRVFCADQIVESMTVYSDACSLKPKKVMVTKKTKRADGHDALQAYLLFEAETNVLIFMVNSCVAARIEIPSEEPEDVWTSCEVANQCRNLRTGRRPEL